MPDSNLIKAFDAARSPDGEAYIVTSALPGIMAGRDAKSAYKLGRLYNNKKSHWLPEALTLFNVNSLTTPSKEGMMAKIFEDARDWKGNTDLVGVVNIAARVGRIGFSFPQWRFVAQGFGQASLIEQFGYTKLARASDVRDETLPKSNPERDEFGVGFVRHEGDWTIEYRRAYILCAHRSAQSPAAIVIRNNSYFFGRDRLPEPVYVSFENLDKDQLQDLTPASFGPQGIFKPLQSSLTGHRDVQKIARLCTVLDHFDKADNDLSRWLTQGEGLKTLLEFSEQALAKQPAGTDKPPFYLARIHNRLPPWFPSITVPMTPATYRAVKERLEGGPVSPELDRLLAGNVHQDTRLALLSGPKGDLPFKPGFSLT